MTTLPPDPAPAAPTRRWLAPASSHLPLLLVLLLGLALRLVALHLAGDLTRLPGDEGYYLDAARSIQTEGRHPGSYRGPGYPFFIALVFQLAGTGNLQAVRIAQILLGLVAIVLVYQLARVEYGARAALGSALAMALAPNLIDFTLFFWAETLYIALWLTILALLHRFHERGRLRELAVAGALFGIAALIREAILPFSAIALAWILFRPAESAVRLRRALVFSACLILPIAPWTVRNYRATGAFVPISSCRWYPIAEGNEGYYPRTVEALRSLQDKSLNEIQAEEYWRTRALASIASQQPGWIFHKIALNVPQLLTPRTQLVRFVENRWYPQYSPLKRHALLTIEVLGHLLALLLGTLGLCLVRPGRLKGLVLLYVGYTFALHIVANADTRFLVPLLPLAFVYVGPLFTPAARARATGVPRLLGWCLALGTVLLSALELDRVRPAWSLTPNVLLISIDTLRADHVGAYGYGRPTSPSLDRLAAEGVLFEQAISPTAWTLPAHVSLLSGVLPRHHGALLGSSRIAADVPWLPETMRQRGYVARAVVNAPFLEEEFGFARGFDSYTYVPKAEWRQHQTTALETLNAEGINRPFFLFVHYMGVHSPYRPPKRFNVFSRPYAGKLTGSQEELRDFVDGKLAIDQRDRDFLVDLYDGAILAVDARVQELLAALRRMRIDENTLVIVTADHGEEFLDHASLWHSKTLYEELIHVPLILRGPGVPAGRRNARLATLMDVAPTVLDLTAALPDPRVDGLSLRAAWASPSAWPAREIELYTSYPDGSRARHGVRTEDVKLVIDLDARRTAFFDLRADPAERMDRYPDPRATPLAALLSHLPPLTGPAPRRPDLTPQTVEELEALGYHSQ